MCIFSCECPFNLIERATELVALVAFTGFWMKIHQQYKI